MAEQRSVAPAVAVGDDGMPCVQAFVVQAHYYGESGVEVRKYRVLDRLAHLAAVVAVVTGVFFKQQVRHRMRRRISEDVCHRPRNHPVERVGRIRAVLHVHGHARVAAEGANRFACGIGHGGGRDKRHGVPAVRPAGRGKRDGRAVHRAPALDLRSGALRVAVEAHQLGHGRGHAAARTVPRRDGIVDRLAADGVLVPSRLEQGRDGNVVETVDGRHGRRGGKRPGGKRRGGRPGLPLQGFPRKRPALSARGARAAAGAPARRAFENGVGDGQRGPGAAAAAKDGPQRPAVRLGRQRARAGKAYQRRFRVIPGDGHEAAAIHLDKVEQRLPAGGERADVSGNAAAAGGPAAGYARGALRRDGLCVAQDACRRGDGERQEPDERRRRDACARFHRCLRRSGRGSAGLSLLPRARNPSTARGCCSTPWRAACRTS